MAKKAIVTGASGFIGSKLVSLLNKQGYQVLALGRKPFDHLPQNKKSFLENSKYLAIDLDDINSSRTILSDFGFAVDIDFAFHLAWFGEKRLSDLSIEAQIKNVSRTTQLYELFASLGVKRFVFVGTMEEAFAIEYTNLNYYKDSKYNRHVIYALAKLAARNALKLIYEKNKPELLFATNSHVMGPGDDKDSFLQVALSKFIRGEDIVMSSGEQNFDVIDVEDCAMAYLAIAENGLNCASYWVGSGRPRQLKDYIGCMQKLYPHVSVKYGAIPYNDIILDLDTFDIQSLTQDTGFKPTLSFMDSVHRLRDFLIDEDAK